jgi:hypothetical protein
MLVRPNTGRILQFYYRLQEFFNLLEKNVDLSWFIEGRMHNKREVICQVLLNVLQKRKKFRVVSCKQLQRWNVIKELTHKWLKSAVRSRSFLWLPTSLLYPIPSSDYHSQTKNVLQVQYGKIFARVHCKMKKWGSLNPESHRMLLHLNIKIEGWRVWQLAQYVSFPKKNCVVLT